jgi:NADH:ubiquinone oxidoreductase subunit 6 (subunit J)
MNNFPAANFIVTGIFLFCLATLIAGALIAVMSTRLIRCVCGLAICCVGLAGIYYFLRSPFLALMEILIYIGAVCVTIVFAIMLAEPDETKQQETRKDGIVWGAVSFGLAASVFWGLWQLGARTNWTPALSRVNAGSVADIGKSLLTTYSLAFEMISLALLVAILGALAISRAGRTKS